MRICFHGSARRQHVARPPSYLPTPSPYRTRRERSTRAKGSGVFAVDPPTSCTKAMPRETGADRTKSSLPSWAAWPRVTAPGPTVRAVVCALLNGCCTPSSLQRPQSAPASSTPTSMRPSGACPMPPLQVPMPPPLPSDPPSLPPTNTHTPGGGPGGGGDCPPREHAQTEAALSECPAV